MKRALILTVGTGTRADVNIVNPLVKTIRDSRPDYICFIDSEDSEKNADAIIARLGLEEKEYHKLSLTTAEDLQKIFIQINGAFRALNDMGYLPEDIVADYTSGTKAMTGALVLSAIYNSCETLKYITGDRKDGIVQDGTERFLSVPPTGIFARREIQMGIRLMTEMRFQTALDVFTSINTSLLDDYESRLRKNAEILATAYASWDHFDHFRFFSEYDKVVFDCPEIKKFMVVKKSRERLLEAAKILKKEKISSDALADLFNNAVRRYSEFKFDDSLGRLYRVVEMFAQYVLNCEHAINTGDVDLSRIPEDKRGDLERYRDTRDGKIKIGLKRAYTLLQELGSEAGNVFSQNQRLQNILNERNSSILAHGVRPIGRDACKSLLLEVAALLAAAIPEFKTKAADLQFPWVSNDIK